MKIPKISIEQLLEAGVHLGHKTLRWNPKMRKYIFGKRDSIHIIDLTQTLELTNNALEKVHSTVSEGGKILFISTKKQASEAVAQLAKDTDQYFVNYRWLGGMLTNWGTISNSIKKLNKINSDLSSENRGFTKKELLKMSGQRDKLQRSLGGIMEMKKIPDLVFIIDTNYESLAIKESIKLGIPIIAILDTNSNPEGIDFPIPGNDDARRSIDLYCNLMKETINDAKKNLNTIIDETKKKDKNLIDTPEKEIIIKKQKTQLIYKIFYEMNDIEKVKQLRQSTGAGFKDCNAALKESKGELEKAVEILRVKGIAKASKKMSRDAKEGVIVISGDEKKASIIEVNCETDFVAKNNDFINFVKELSEINNKCSSKLDKLLKSNMDNGKTVEENIVALIAKIGEKITIGKMKTLENSNSLNFFYQHSKIQDNVSKLGVIVSLETDTFVDEIRTFGKQLSMHIAASNPLAINFNDINPDVIDNEQKLINEELKNSGKPDDIIKKISEGRIKKFKEENSLMTQNWVMEPKKTVNNILDDLNNSNLKIKEYTRIKIGD